jgi:hypothetical protein
MVIASRWRTMTRTHDEIMAGLMKRPKAEIAVKR